MLQIKEEVLCFLSPEYNCLTKTILPDLEVLNYLLLTPTVDAGDLFYYAMDADYLQSSNNFFGPNEEKEILNNHMHNVSTHILRQITNDDSLEYGLTDLALVLSQKTLKFNKIFRYSKCYSEDYKSYCKEYFKHLSKDKTVRSIEAVNQV